MKIAYADPPYPGCAHLYKNHPDYAGEVNHQKLINQIEEEYDGFILHSNSVSLPYLLPMFSSPIRIMAWVKPFAAFKKNVPVAYAWEPVIIKACRKPVVSGRIVMRDWISHVITLKKGLTGAKPPPVIEWAFEVVGAQPNDILDDLYPGTGIVTTTWKQWKNKVECTSSSPTSSPQ